LTKLHFNFVTTLYILNRVICKTCFDLLSFSDLYLDSKMTLNLTDWSLNYIQSFHRISQRFEHAVNRDKHGLNHSIFGSAKECLPHLSHSFAVDCRVLDRLQLPLVDNAFNHVTRSTIGHWRRVSLTSPHSTCVLH